MTRHVEVLKINSFILEESAKNNVGKDTKTNLFAIKMH